jgi:hypothetical protein
MTLENSDGGQAGIRMPKATKPIVAITAVQRSHRD